jgi:hypothetical protein
MPETKKILVGLGASAIVSATWQVVPTSNQYKLALAESPLSFLEHYHFGIVSLIAGRVCKNYSMYLYGFGGGLIVAECAQPEPFGINKPTFGASTALGLVLTTILALSCG